MKSLLGIASALALFCAHPQNLPAEELTAEQIKEIVDLYATAQSHLKAANYAESNNVLKQVLGKLPTRPVGQYDGDFDRILEEINGNYQSLDKVEEANKYLRGVFEQLPAPPPGQHAPNRETVLKKIHRNRVLRKEYVASNAILNELLGYYPEPKRGPTQSTVSLSRAQVLYALGANYSELGEKENAVKSLQAAVDVGFWNYDVMSRDAKFSALRSHPGFQAAVEAARRAVASVAFGLKDIDGKEVKAEDYKGKVVILDIWGTWCPPCRMEIPHFVRLQKEYRDKGLRIIGLTWEQAEPTPSHVKLVQHFAQTNQVNYPLILLTRARLESIPNVRSFPTTLFVGRDGTVKERVSGYHDYNQLKAKVERLLNAPVRSGAAGN